MYKVSNGLSPLVVSNIFTQNTCHSYNLRLNSQFSRAILRSVLHEIESMSYLGPVIWDIIPDNYKNLPNFSVFKNKIKNRKPRNCPCRLCKTYISRSYIGSHSGKLDETLAFLKFLTFMIIIKFIFLVFT